MTDCSAASDQHGVYVTASSETDEPSRKGGQEGEEQKDTEQENKEEQKRQI